jgi:PBSX family phage terminase large subunit
MTWIEKSLAASITVPMHRSLWLRKTRASLTESIMQAFEDYTLTDELHAQVGYCSRGHRQNYTFANGSMIVPSGMDTPDRLLSTEYDKIYIFQCEELSERDYQFAISRLSGKASKYRQIGSDCNPQHPGHWLNRRFMRPGTQRIQSRHEDNPRWHDGKDWTPEGLDLLATLNTLTGVQRERLLYGRWSASEGMVYDNYDVGKHIIDEMPKGWESWRKVRAIDFGYTNPFVCQWWAIDGDGRAFLYREYVKAGVTVKNHAEEIKRLSGSETYEQTIADHDAEDRATLAECGISTVAAIKDVSRGIQAVADRLRLAGDGKPRLFVLRSSLVSPAPEGKPYGFLAEIEGYLWHPAKDGKADKEEPIKQNDHSMDTARYAMMAIDKPIVPIFAFPDEEPNDGGNDFDNWSDDV